jgi:hypothetical protein
MTSEVMDGPPAAREAALPHRPPHPKEPPCRTSPRSSTRTSRPTPRPDPTRRAGLIAEAWATDGRLLDPPLTGAGHDGISQAADVLQQHYAGHTFRRTSAVDEHHGQLRYAWELVAPDGGAVLTGLDVGELAEDGRLARVTGFFGELAPAEGSVA